MKTTNKLSVNICVRVDQETSQMIERLAKYYNRKPADLVRLVLVPALCNQWARMEQEQHQENKEPLQVAKFNG